MSIHRNLDNEASEYQKDAKTTLQEHLQSQRIELPKYSVVEVTGEAHAQQFTVECYVAVMNKPTKGEGSSRREAEQNAALKALEVLKVKL